MNAAIDLSEGHQALLKRVRLVQIETSFNGSLIRMAGGIITLPIIGFLLWEKVPHARLIIWLTLALLSVLNFSFTTFIFKREQRTDAKNYRLGHRLLIWTALVTGITWGLSSYLFFPLSSTLEAYLVMIMAMVAMTGASAVYRPSMLVFLGSMSIVFVIGVILRGSDMHFFAASTFLIFSAVTAFYSALQNNQMHKAILLGFENDVLLRNIKTQKMEADIAKEEAICARKAAEEANLGKTRFLASASHDLRQPMHALGLYISYLRKIAGPSFTEIIEKIQSATQTMEDLFNQILTIAKLEIGTQEVNIKSFPLADLFLRIEPSLSAMAAENNIELRIVPTSLHIISDEIQLERMIRNLVINAIRYTNKGKVLIGCRRQKDKISIEVWDTGVGIPIEKQTKIFDEYYQVENSERDRKKGLGLGLAIVKHLSSILGHQIGVASTVGKGSMFSVQVPRSLSPLMQVRSFVSEYDQYGFLCDMGIIVIDDDPLVLDSMATILSYHGCKIVAADSGASAIDILKSNTSFYPHLILCDYRLRNGETGIETIEKIRKHNKQNIQAILISGDTSPEELKKVLNVGFPMLHKPVNQKLLFETIKQQFGYASNNG